MQQGVFDIIVIGSGSGGLSVGLFMAKAGFSTLMISRSDHDIGGDCLNDGCVPSKAFIHAARIVHSASLATAFGLTVHGSADLSKVRNYVHHRQQEIRQHENAQWLKEQGVHVALGNAVFTGNNHVEVSGTIYKGKKIVIATGSQPRKLNVPGIDKITYYDNENIFQVKDLPQRLLVIGGGPIGLEIAQAMSRFGSKVIVVNSSDKILQHDDEAVTDVLQNRLEKEGIQFLHNSKVEQFTSATEATMTDASGNTSAIEMDAVFVAIGRHLNIETLQLQKASIQVSDNKIVVDKYLRTTNHNVMVCGDMVGDLMFSHAAEFHARIILNNLLSPFKKKLDNKHMSWVTFTDPEVATFGYSAKQLKNLGIAHEILEEDFSEDDRAVVDDHQYGRFTWFISRKHWWRKQTILGGTMVAPHAGELIQELILANTAGLSLNAIFNKVYPYPVAARINQKMMVEYKSRALTELIKKLLRIAYKIFN